jgi:hypothetical protein
MVSALKMIAVRLQRLDRAGFYKRPGSLIECNQVRECLRHALDDLVAECFSFVLSE